MTKQEFEGLQQKFNHSGMTLKSFLGQLFPALVAGVGLALADASGLRIVDGTDLQRQSVRKRH